MMRRTNKVFWGSIFVAAIFSQWGCMGPSIYQQSGILGGGYRDKSLNDNGLYEVYFLGQGRNYDFVKLAAVYRAAEITYNHGYHYFRVTKVEDKSEELVVRNEYGGESHSYIPIILLNIQCLDHQPEKGYDAYHFLNVTPVPGTKELCTIADREKDKRNGDPDDP
jgi:hypothetical protein